MIGKNLKGVSTLEILIAFAVLTLVFVAVITVIFSARSVGSDTQLSTEALYKAQTQLEGQRSLSRQNFGGVVATTSTERSGPLIYTKTVAVMDLTQCKKQASSTVAWQSGGRTLNVTLTTVLTDVAGALALGGDCIDDTSGKLWNNPQRFASDTISPGKPVSLDELDRYVYLGADKNPFLYIADTRSAVLGQNSGLFVNTGAFNLGVQPNWLDAIKWTDPITSAVKYYVFAAVDTTTNQLLVIDATVPTTPTVVSTRALAGVSAAGSFPQGWIVQYYKNRLYVVTRETAGPEFHIFNVTDPANPVELGGGTEMNMTIDGLFVREQVVAGATKRYAYVASDQNGGELQVYDVTDPGGMGTIAAVAAAKQDLPGSTDGQSVYAVGNKLYMGRLSGTGPDLYIFDISNPPAGLTQLGSIDIGTGALAIRVAGKFAFISTPKTNQEFQVWNISNPASISSVAVFNFGNVANEGMDYDPDFIYVTGQATPNFQIVYSPT